MAKVQDMCRCFYTDAVSDLIMYKCEVHWKVFGATLRESAALNRQVEDARVFASSLTRFLKEESEPDDPDMRATEYGRGFTDGYSRAVRRMREFLLEHGVKPS